MGVDTLELLVEERLDVDFHSFSGHCRGEASLILIQVPIYTPQM